MVKPTTEQFLTDIEREIQSNVRTKPPFHEPGTNPPTVHSPATMPEYVEHRDGATEIGKLSAEAVVREYEAAAKEIEAMGADLVERAKQCERVTADALAVTDELKEIAARYRTEAKRVFDQIENCSFVVAEVRKACTELRDKIAAPTTIERPKKR
jgi:hypothetical protein